VKDIAFSVESVEKIYERSVKGGAVSIVKPHELKDENGTVILATVQTYGDTTHTFVDRSNYKGSFLPGYKPHHLKEAFNDLVKPVNFNKVDHIVGNQPNGGMEGAVNYYENCLDWHRFWSVDDKTMHTEFSALRSVVVTDFDENVKMPINEPAAGKKKSQIQEYVDYYHDAGVQHIAMNTS
jgi:4-hydroxyphenylpyruvate dioxygenase